LRVPLNALVLVASVVIVLSIIYIASATAFNALISLQAIALHLSYSIPILFMLLRRLKVNKGLPPPQYGPFQLGKWGPAVNVFSLCYLAYVVTWMPFPQIIPVTGDTMNYSGVIVGAVILGALADWFVTGRKRFQMPVARYGET
jgi:choline transport protein